MEELINTTSFIKILDAFYKFYRNEFGDLKFNEVVTKVNDSNKIQSLIRRAKFDRVRLGTEDYLLTINSSISFAFAKGEVVFLASIMALSAWEDEVGAPLHLSDDIYMNTMFFRLLSKCERLKTHFSGTPNFFDKLTDQLVYGFLRPNNNPLYPFRMPDELFDQLEGKTTNEGVEQGIIVHLGNDTGDFYLYWEEHDIYYAIVNGYSILIQKEAIEALPSDDDVFSFWKFYRDEENNQCFILA